ncbi:site-specific integrase [Xanthomonas sp. 3075]|uniref:site-specific integrase n=1 Tax=Xanthomonas sp. 3075 TaxID=3035315 RepID=UPI0017BF1F24|nr:site-specific integrase [Xanthomonas sp. 3075]MBB4132643.1 integrase [Xanthomonas sp. 3075]
MKLPHYLTKTASGRYVYRQRVPTDLRKLIGREFIKRSLGHNLLDARQAALWLASRYAAAFKAMRGQGVAKITVDEVLKNLAAQGSRAYEIDLPNGYRLKANDEADHARAMEAIAAIGQLHQPKSADPAAMTVAETITLGDAKTKWLASLEAVTIPKTLAIKKTAIEDLTFYLGLHRDVHTIGRPDLARFYQHLRDKGNSTPAIYNKQSYLGKTGFFAWAMASGYYPKGDNPATDHIKYGAREKRQRKKLGFKSFTAEQLLAIYSSINFEKMSPGARWASVLGLYTGARASEVGQLLLTDVAKIDGVLAIKIGDEGDGQRVKNESSNRIVPIHPDLIKLGLLDFVEVQQKRGETRLFSQADPKAKNGAGNWISKAFTRHLVTVGSDWPEAKRGFHSLRKTVIQELQGAGVASELRAQLVGHELDDEHHSTYSREFTLAEKLNGTGKFPGLSVLNYGLDLEALRSLLTAAVSKRTAKVPGRKSSSAARLRNKAATSLSR